jgi:DNA-binding GntR family transcriptional regulator
MTKKAGGSGELAAVLPVAPDRTVENQITQRLRTLIVEGKLKPGVRLRYRDVADRLGVSVTPVRVSLRDLAIDGLVTVSPQGAVRVASLSVEEVEEVYSARAGLESLLAERGVERLGADGLGLMKRRLPAVERAARNADLPGFLDAVWNYRLPCYEAAERPRILDMVTVYVNRCRRYNFLTFEDAHRFQTALTYNLDYLRACETGNATAAAAVIRESNEWTREVVRAKLELHPEAA